MVRLRAGTNLLRATVAGQNPQAKGFQAGIDRILLTPDGVAPGE
jgi:hypothetical protein